MSELRFRVPLPPRVLSPNAHERHNYRVVGAAKRDYRRLVRFLAASAANEANWRRPERARVSLLAGTGRHAILGTGDDVYRPRDHGNLIAAWKAGFDGLCDAGVIVDDDARHMEMWRVVIDETGEPGIEVVVAGVA